MNSLVFEKKITNLLKLNTDLIEHQIIGPIYESFSYSINKADDSDPKLEIKFKQQLSQDQINTVTDLIINFVEISVHQTLVGYLRTDVSKFVDELIFNFAASNIELGITQAGKTKEVGDVLRDVNYYLRGYSLYAAIDEINRIIIEDLPTLTLSPFITEDRMSEFRAKIQNFLGN